MTTLRIGDRVAYQGRVYCVRGFSPMSISPRRLLLEDDASRQTVEITEAELAAQQEQPLQPRR